MICSNIAVVCRNLQQLCRSNWQSQDHEYACDIHWIDRRSFFFTTYTCFKFGVKATTQWAANNIKMGGIMRKVGEKSLELERKWQGPFQLALQSESMHKDISHLNGESMHSNLSAKHFVSL